jgi:hypothetical protein
LQALTDLRKGLRQHLGGAAVPPACSGFPLTPATGAGLKLIRMEHQPFGKTMRSAVGPLRVGAITPASIRNAA